MHKYLFGQIMTTWTFVLSTLSDIYRLSITFMFYHVFQLGLTCVHSAARHGHSDVLGQLRAMNISMKITSKKTGLGPLHVAAFDGNIGGLITYQR